jgi:hypothetical protein
VPLKADSRLMAISLALMLTAASLYVVSTPFLYSKIETQNWLAFLLCETFAAVGIIGFIILLKKNLFGY